MHHAHIVIQQPKYSPEISPTSSCDTWYRRLILGKLWLTSTCDIGHGMTLEERTEYTSCKFHYGTQKKIQYRYTTGQRDIITLSLNCCAHTITAILHRSYDAKCFLERKQGFHVGHSISDAGKISDTHSDLYIDAPVPISSGYSSFVNRNGRWVTPRSSRRI